MELKTYDFPPCTPKPDWDTIKEMAAQANYAVELNQLSGFQEAMATVEGDPFLDGKMPAMNLMEGTGKAAGHEPVTPGDG